MLLRRSDVALSALIDDSHEECSSAATDNLFNEQDEKAGAHTILNMSEE